MLSHLSFTSRQVIEKLLSGTTATLGEDQLGPLNEEDRKLLFQISTNLSDLNEEKGGTLKDKIITLFENAPSLDQVPVTPSSQALTPKNYKLGKLEASSFRGLAPAGEVWNHDFQGDSHLLYGPNGCGKSSLLGAISWCLTGKLFRDDKPPKIPEDISVFSTDDPPKSEGTRPDILTLTNKEGDITDSFSEYWVALELLQENANENEEKLWVRRHSVNGLDTSTDGATWQSIESLNEINISELDTELLILMPARASHLKFGNNPDLLSLFSQIIGLNDLQNIADIATGSIRALKSGITNIKKKEITPLNNKISEIIEKIKSNSIEKTKTAPGFLKIIKPERTLDEINDFENELNSLTESLRKQLASDLEIQIPEPETDEYAKCQEELKNLPGQVSLAINELKKPVEQLFKTSLGLEIPSKEELDNLTSKLTLFENAAKNKIKNRIQWAIREKENEKLSLFLKAAEHYHEEENKCPVCTQSLEPVPEIAKELITLKPLGVEDYLQQKMGDFELTLINQLNEIIAKKLQDEGKSKLHDRLISDWLILKEVRFSGLLNNMAANFDSKITSIKNTIQPPLQKRHPTLTEDLPDGFNEFFKGMEDALKSAHQYIELADSIILDRENLKLKISQLIKPARENDDSLSGELERGVSTNDDINSLEALLDLAKSLKTEQKRLSELNKELDKYNRLAGFLEKLKSINISVQKVITNEVRGIGDAIKKYYEHLYNDEILLFDSITPGHAANPNIKNELNIYFKSSNQKIPVGPFSNAGRLRGLILSFVFALLGKSKKSINFLILDDPALSLDDEHKSRFMDYLVNPFKNNHQIIVATHYENLLKISEHHFIDDVCLHMSPRPRNCDKVLFDPSGLLDRVEESLKKPGSFWQESAGNLRKWVERSLGAISGYCPEPFMAFNNFTDSINNYQKISHPKIVHENKDKIIKTLKHIKVKRILNATHHDGEELSKTEIQDCLSELKACRKDFNNEIERLKKLYNHSQLARELEPRPKVGILSLGNSIPANQDAYELTVIGEAAAAENGVGVNIDNLDPIQLTTFEQALVKHDTISPIALPGQYLLLDSEEILPNPLDLIIGQTDDGEKYLRRFWSEDHRIHLLTTNPITPYPPVEIKSSVFNGRRIVGVIYDGPSNFSAGSPGDEWAYPNQSLNLSEKKYLGIKVYGDSMLPLARNGQIILVKEEEDFSKVKNGDLACVDIKETGAVIKKCFPSTQKWQLCSINQTDTYEPINADLEDIQHVYILAGVLFEHNSL